MIDFNKIQIVGKSGNLFLLIRNRDIHNNDTRGIKACTFSFDGTSVGDPSLFPCIDTPLRFNAYEVIADVQQEHWQLAINQRIVDSTSKEINDFLS